MENYFDVPKNFRVSRTRRKNYRGFVDPLNPCAGAPDHHRHHYYYHHLHHMIIMLLLLLRQENMGDERTAVRHYVTSIAILAYTSFIRRRVSSIVQVTIAWNYRKIRNMSELDSSTAKCRTGWPPCCI